MMCRIVTLALVLASLSCGAASVSLSELSNAQKTVLGNYGIYRSAHGVSPTLPFSRDELKALQFLADSTIYSDSKKLSSYILHFKNYLQRHPLSEAKLRTILNAAYYMGSRKRILYTLAYVYAEKFGLKNARYFDHGIIQLLDLFSKISRHGINEIELYKLNDIIQAHSNLVVVNNANDDANSYSDQSIVLPSTNYPGRMPLGPSTSTVDADSHSDQSVVLPSDSHLGHVSSKLSSHPSHESAPAANSPTERVRSEELNGSIIIQNFIHDGVLNLSDKELHNADLLRTIPEELKATIQDINLSHNNISEIPDGLFTLFPMLVRINLSHNAIRDLHRPFERLNNLLFIDLSFNGISDMSSRVFDGLSNLKSIKLQNNRLSTLNTGETVLPNLEILDLSNNPIKIINKEYFNNMPKLQKISVTTDLRTAEKFNNLRHHPIIND